MKHAALNKSTNFSTKKTQDMYDLNVPEECYEDSELNQRRGFYDGR